MDELTRKHVIETLGDLDDVTVAAILRAGASVQELAEAHAWRFDKHWSTASERPRCGVGGNCSRRGGGEVIMRMKRLAGE